MTNHKCGQNRKLKETRIHKQFSGLSFPTDNDERHKFEARFIPCCKDENCFVGCLGLSAGGILFGGRDVMT